jgi:hypothetical protein
MSAEQVVEYCWWYLEHLHLFLIPAAVFDIVCWIAIAIYLKRRRVGRLSEPAPDAGARPLPPTMAASGRR